MLDGSGNALADTSWRFWTLDEDTLGAIAGTVTDPDSAGRGAIYVSVFPLNKPEEKQTQVLDNPGLYEIARLFPGKYRIEAFRDEDGNGQYSMGRLSPFTLAERFTVYPDTVTVRSGWVKEGHNFSLPNP